MTVTDSHSALHSAEIGETTPVGDSNASVRAPAREGHESTAQFEPQSAVTDSDRIGDVWAWFAAWITPPDIWEGGLKEDWEYACRGEWTNRSGVFRRAGQAYAVAALPISATLLYARWIIRRFSRLAAALLLLWFLAQFPPVSWLI